MSERHRASGRHRRRSRNTSQPLFAVGAVAAAALAFPGVDGGNPADAAAGSETNAPNTSATLSLAAAPTSAATKAAQGQAALKVLQAQAELRIQKREATARKATPARASRSRREAVAKIKAPAKVVKRVSVTTALPVTGFRLTADFGQSGGRWSSGRHTGQDFAVPTGTTVRSVAKGTVVSAGWGGAYGNRIVIEHSDGRYTTYNHLSKILVSAGSTVSMSQRIGLSGSTGNSTGPHLHFEVLNSEKTPIGPLTWLRSRGVKI